MAVKTWIYGKPDIQYEGCVIDTYERNGYHDSDFYAVCWDREKKCVVEVEYDTTRCGAGGVADIDATDEVIREVYRWYKKVGRGIFDHDENPRQAKAIRKGDLVKVIRGTKVPKGMAGTVFWIGTSYNPYSRQNEKRVGFEDAHGNRYFVPADYAEVIGWEDRLVRGVERKRQIRNFAINSMPYHYRHHFYTNTAYRKTRGR